MFDGLEDGAATFYFLQIKIRQKPEQPLVRRYDRHESFVEQLAIGEVNEEERLLMIDELFKEALLDARQTLDILRVP